MNGATELLFETEAIDGILDESFLAVLPDDGENLTESTVSEFLFNSIFFCIFRRITGNAIGF